MGLLHDELLGTNVLLLSRVDYVPLLQDLHGEGFVFITLELNLTTGEGEKREENIIERFGIKKNSCHCHAAVPPYQLHATKATDPQSVDDVEVSQVEIEEESILCFVPAEGGKLWKQD